MSFFFVAWNIKPDLNLNFQVCQRIVVHRSVELRMTSLWINIITIFIIITIIIEIIF